ncbi:MAG: adenylyltransferase/cytidyltransferase family protein [Elusimicrobiota bacterium]
MGRIYKSVDILVKKLETERNGKKIVFTNGCFDIIHPGHIHILREASKKGDILIVGINTDDSVKKIKGPARPVFNENARAETVSSMEMVDYVLMFSEETPYRIIKKIKPDVLVKGSQYSEKEIVGEDIAKETVRVKMMPGYSTSDIINKIQNIKNV